MVHYSASRGTYTPSLYGTRKKRLQCRRAISCDKSSNATKSYTKQAGHSTRTSMRPPSTASANTVSKWLRPPRDLGPLRFATFDKLSFSSFSGGGLARDIEGMQSPSAPTHRCKKMVFILLGRAQGTCVRFFSVHRRLSYRF